MPKDATSSVVHVVIEETIKYDIRTMNDELNMCIGLDTLLYNVSKQRHISLNP